MAPIHQSSLIADQSSEISTKNTNNSANMVYNTKKECYTNTSSSSSTNNISNNYSSERQKDIDDRLFRNTEMLLPITTKGQFFQDAFFEDAREHFQTAVRNVLNRSGHNFDAENNLTTYRMLRNTDLSEDSQAATVTETETSHQVVIDVRDFMTGDIKVKVVDENEIVVEGSMNQESGGSVSKKNFRRSFTFPGLVKSEEITSTMSSDGVLTVTVPKKETTTRSHHISIQESSTNTNVKSSGATNTADESLQKSSATHSRKSSVAPTATTSKNSFTEESMDHEASSKLNSTTESTSKKSISENYFPIQPSNILPISQGGLFFQDSFFAQAHQEFKEAMKNVLNSVGESPKSDIMTSYRSLREGQQTEENQAVSVTEDSHQHKVVMDVHDFMAEGVRVKVVNENEVVVEGSMDQQKEGSVSKKNFRRSFTFPGIVKDIDIAATMSSDGILTIIVPKKKQSPEVQVTKTNSMTMDNAASKRKESSSSISSSSLRSVANGSVHKEKIISTQEKVSNKTHENDIQKRSNLSHQSMNTRQDHLDVSRESSWVVDSLLPVFPKGPFLQDSYFKESRQHFEAAVKEALTRLGQEESTANISLYRNLRSNDKTNESQAIKVTQNEQTHQIVLDVQDFMKGDISVKVVGKNKVQVEGRVAQQEGSSKSTRSFRRSFNLPGVIDVSVVTSALSSDGVLTIKAPKSVAQANKRDC